MSFVLVDRFPKFQKSVGKVANRTGIFAVLELRGEIDSARPALQADSIKTLTI